jgi:hypothetical protein
MVNQGRGDTELMLWFDPDDLQQVDFVVGKVRPRKRRTVEVTPEMRDHLARIRQARRIPVFAQGCPLQSGLDDRRMFAKGIGPLAPC